MRAFDLVGKASVIAVIFGDIGNLGRGFADDLARIARLQAGQLASVFGHKIGQTIEQLTARCGRHVSPFRSKKRRVRRLNRCVYIGLTGLRHKRPSCACGRIEALKLGARFGEVATDILLKLLHFISLGEGRHDIVYEALKAGAFALKAHS